MGLIMVSIAMLALAVGSLIEKNIRDKKIEKLREKLEKLKKEQSKQ
jgi:ribosomal protein L29